MVPEVYLELNRQTINTFESNVSVDTWNGLRLLTIDGTTLRLPDVESIRSHFGERSGGQGVACPLGRMSELYDPINKLTIEALVTPIHIGERQHAHRLMLHLMPNDLVVLDRGYPAFSFFKTVTWMNANFCARMTTKWSIVKNFLKLGLKEQVIDMYPTKQNVDECSDLAIDATPIKIRLLKIELSSGEKEILATTLIDSKAYPHGLFAELYHQRWFVEEDYKSLKLPLELENFTGKTVQSVYQDCYAQIFAKNLTSILSFEARRQIKKAGKKEKFVHQINFTYALSKTKEVMTRLFHSTRLGFEALLKALDVLYFETTEPVRPGRNFKRNHRIFKRVYCSNRKSIA